MVARRLHARARERERGFSLYGGTESPRRHDGASRGVPSSMVRARGHWLIGFLDQLPAEVVIGLAALRFLSTAPMPKFLHDRRAVLLDRLSVLVKIAFFFACPTIVMLLVWLLVSLNCYVLLIMPEEHLKLPPISRAVGYTLLALQMASYSRTLRIHPGSPSAEWRRAAASGAVDHFVCRRSGRLLPPRGFHIRVINEDILFLDHFCAWINRPIGLRNRKCAASPDFIEPRPSCHCVVTR